MGIVRVKDVVRLNRERYMTKVELKKDDLAEISAKDKKDELVKINAKDKKDESVKK